jgi:hypothetical protein|tara:strand:- start:643 stop:834 length:192 start_codon:yes stop_codon:yes gene_type:complete
MDTSKMREEFLTQLKDYEFKIKRGEEELAKLKEYKLKLEGGLETLDLLDKREENGSDTSQHSD